jgi:Flp pilus assembly pilin Flp
VHHVCTSFSLHLSTKSQCPEENTMSQLIRSLWSDEQGQDIAEYAVMLAVILVLVVGTVRLIGSNSNNAFSSVARSLQ